MKDATAISQALRADFPMDVFEFKSNKVYLPADVVIERLLDATDGQFSWTKISYEIRESDGVMKARNGGYIPKVMIFEGLLSIPGLGERYGCGVQELEENSGADSAYKGAESDAIKRAARGFGVGLKQLYINPIKQGQTNERPQRSTQQQSSPPPSVQHDNINPDQFLQSWKIAFGTKSKEAIADSFNIAGTNLDLWQLMYESMPDRKTLTWLIDEMSKKGVEQSDTFRKGVDAYRSSLTA